MHSSVRRHAWQAHTNAKGLLAHLNDEELAGVFAALGASDGPATLDGVRLLGPAGTLEDCRQAAADLHGTAVEFCPLESGFQRFELSGVNLGMLDYSK